MEAFQRCGQLPKLNVFKHLSSNPSRCASTKNPQKPKVTLNIRHIRENPKLYAETCIQRNYKALADHPAKIITLFEQWREQNKQLNALRRRSKDLQTELTMARQDESQGAPNESLRQVVSEILMEAQHIKKDLSQMEDAENLITTEIHDLAEELPNLTSEDTPIGNDPDVIGYINEDLGTFMAQLNAKEPRSHLKIGTDLGLLDFSAASVTSGWGWYYLKNEAALLEQALVQYAISIAMEHGFKPVSPPSIVYSHVSAACGFTPRDQGGEQQTYVLHQDLADRGRGKPELCLAGTAEIPFAAMKANSSIMESDLPLRVVGSSRCYRAEAGGRGVDTKGLYRVHEFTKVEMFGWSRPNSEAAEKLFESMILVQTKILKSLGLYCRIVEQPTMDLGASATRKRDIEAYFPSRTNRADGWGEVTSTSICTDYQTRRLATRIQRSDLSKMDFPFTVNGTALAVPRVLAAILETHWSDSRQRLEIPQVLGPWMYGIKFLEKEV